MFRHYDDTQKWLEDHLELVCEETANYLVVWCIDLEMEEVISSFVICFF
jgi:cell division cycle protein 37